MHIFQYHFFMIFGRFGFRKRSQNRAFFIIYLFENVDFVKIAVFLWENCYFSGFEPPKYDSKSIAKRARKKHRKKASRELIFASILASKNSLKSTQHPKKSQKNYLSKKTSKKQPWTLAQLGGNHRKPSLLGF